jgi:hypothetical protein
MSRLGGAFERYPQWPVPYLLGCYARAGDEARAAASLKDPADRQRLVDALALVRQLTVSYVGLIFEVGMFPQPAAAAARGPLQLLDAMYAAAAASGGAGAGGYGAAPVPGAQPLIPDAVTAATAVVPMPPGFFTDFAERFEGGELDAVVNPIGEEGPCRGSAPNAMIV